MTSTERAVLDAMKEMTRAYAHARRSGLTEDFLNSLLSPNLSDEQKLELLAELTDGSLELVKTYLERSKDFERVQGGELAYLTEVHRDPHLRKCATETTLIDRLLTSINHKMVVCA